MANKQQFTDRATASKNSFPELDHFGDPKPKPEPFPDLDHFGDPKPKPEPFPDLDHFGDPKF